MSNQLKLFLQIATALFCTAGTVITFTWTGRGWVDDLKQTVTDNATDSRHRTDSLFLDVQSRVDNNEYRLNDITDRTTAIESHIRTSKK